eukprot:scaffold138089_cov28-Tisochrysis_lutea.AAC.1
MVVPLPSSARILNASACRSAGEAPHRCSITVPTPPSESNAATACGSSSSNRSGGVVLASLASLRLLGPFSCASKSRQPATRRRSRRATCSTGSEAKSAPGPSKTKAWCKERAFCSCLIEGTASSPMRPLHQSLPTPLEPNISSRKAVPTATGLPPMRSGGRHNSLRTSTA